MVEKQNEEKEYQRLMSDPLYKSELSDGSTLGFWIAGVSVILFFAACFWLIKEFPAAQSLINWI